MSLIPYHHASLISIGISHGNGENFQLYFQAHFLEAIFCLSVEFSIKLPEN